MGLIILVEWLFLLFKDVLIIKLAGCWQIVCGPYKIPFFAVSAAIFVSEGCEAPYGVNKPKDRV